MKKFYRLVIETPENCEAKVFSDRAEAVRGAISTLCAWAKERKEYAIDAWNRFYSYSIAYVTSFWENEDGEKTNFNDEEWFPEDDFLREIGFVHATKEI